MSEARLLLVGNPTAQSGRNAARIERARGLLDAEGLHHDFLATAPHGQTVGLVRDALVGAGDRYHTVVYMGGDGTFAEVAKGILAADAGRRVRLGMLPTGTANDQGRSFGLSAEEPELPRNVHVIADGHESALDAVKLRALDEQDVLVREDWFFDSCGWGISPRVLAMRNEDRETISKIPVVRDLWRDQLVYAGALFRTFLASYVDDDKFDVEIETPDGELRFLPGLTDLVVKNTRIYGGAWVLAPGSAPDDGLVEIVPFAGKRDWISKAIVALDASGQTEETLGLVGVKHSDSIAVGKARLRLRPRPGGVPLAAQIDGEEFPSSAHAEIEVAPRALRVIIPGPPPA